MNTLINYNIKTDYGNLGLKLLSVLLLSSRLFLNYTVYGIIRCKDRLPVLTTANPTPAQAAIAYLQPYGDGIHLEIIFTDTGKIMKKPNQTVKAILFLTGLAAILSIASFMV